MIEFFENHKITLYSVSKYLKQNPNVKQQFDQLYQNYKDRFQFLYFVKFYLLGILDKKCPYCGKSLNQKQLNLNRVEYCSLKCVANSYKIKQIKEKTIVQKYGNKQNFQKSNLEKRKKTNLEKYGCEFGVQSNIVKQKIKQTNLNHCGYQTNLKSKSTKDKIKKTNLYRYGCQNVAKSKDIKQKIKQTNIQRYGVDNLFLSEEIQQKCRKSLLKKDFLTNLEKWKQFVIPLFNIEDYHGQKYKYKWKCVKCGNQWQQHLYTTNHIKELKYLPRCLNCYPYNNGDSESQKSVLQFIKSICFDKIETHNKTLIKPYQIDIYIPNKKIGIQFDGLIWHSNKFKKDDFNLLHKTEMCQELGIKLIHVFEDQWLYNRNFVQKMIELNFNQNINIFDYAEKYQNNQYVFDRRYFSKLDFKDENISYIEPKKFYINGNKRSYKENQFYIFDCGKFIIKK